MDIQESINKYSFGDNPVQKIKLTERYASFDFCFNYFQAFRESGRIEAISDIEHLQTSCLQLGFYLASWGMLRGSSFLLEKSLKVYEPVIIAIANAGKTWWEIDADCYTSANIDHLIECRDVIAKAFVSAGAPSDTLITKIMLGVFGNVPAFDTNFKTGFGVNTFGKKALEKIALFYKDNEKIIETCQRATVDFATGRRTCRFYTRAKVIDMLFYIEGAEKLAQNQTLKRQVDR